jgi:tripartite-type tricarboxylate transporter receptor subunit TctC
MRRQRCLTKSILRLPRAAAHRRFRSANSAKAFIEESQKDQGSMNFASVGAGTTHHLTQRRA